MAYVELYNNAQNHGQNLIVYKGATMPVAAAFGDLLSIVVGVVYFNNDTGLFEAYAPPPVRAEDNLLQQLVYNTPYWVEVNIPSGEMVTWTFLDTPPIIPPVTPPGITAGFPWKWVGIGAAVILAVAALGKRKRR